MLPICYLGGPRVQTGITCRGPYSEPRLGVRAPTGLDDPGRTSSPNPGDDVWPGNRRGPVGTLTILNPAFWIPESGLRGWVWASADRVTPLIPVIPATRVQMDCHPGLLAGSGGVGRFVMGRPAGRPVAYWRHDCCALPSGCVLCLGHLVLAPRGPETMWGPRRTTRLTGDASSARATCSGTYANTVGAKTEFW